MPAGTTDKSFLDFQISGELQFLRFLVRIYQANLSELITFWFLKNNQKTNGFLMIPMEIEVN